MHSFLEIRSGICAAAILRKLDDFRKLPLKQLRSLCGAMIPLPPESKSRQHEVGQVSLTAAPRNRTSASAPKHASLGGVREVAMSRSESARCQLGDSASRLRISAILSLVNRPSATAIGYLEKLFGSAIDQDAVDLEERKSCRQADPFVAINKGMVLDEMEEVRSGHNEEISWRNRPPKIACGWPGLIRARLAPESPLRLRSASATGHEVPALRRPSERRRSFGEHFEKPRHEFPSFVVRPRGSGPARQPESVRCTDPFRPT